MSDRPEIREVEPGELDAWCEGEWMSWGYRQGGAWRGVLAGAELTAATDVGSLIGGTAAVPFLLTVPGAVVPAAGIASVWVSPARRGEGLFRRLMERQLARLVDQELPAVVLVASEPAIYRRFGFGTGALAARLRIDCSSRSVALDAESAGVSVTGRDEGMLAARAIFERVRPTVPGMLDRDEAWWAYSYPEEDADEASPVLFALAGSGADADGFAAYSVRDGWTEEGRPDNTLVLHELVAETPGAYATLWSYCLGLALCNRVEADNRPVDEPLTHLLAAPENVRQSTVDGLHLRIFDVGALLTGRRYSATDALVLAVRDELGGWARGEWLVEGGPDGASCEPTRRDPDIALDAQTLASVYLGASSFEALRRAGLVEELRPGAVRRADALFSWTPAPWLSWDY